MPNYLKPQSPIQFENNYIYPLTTADQVITGNGERLNSLFKKTIRESATLRAANWSETLPHTQTITLRESTDDYNVDANVAYGNGDNAALNKAAGCLSYIKKNHKEITFYCLKNKPEVDIPIEIAGTCRNTIATVEEGTKLKFDIKRYNTEEELLADTPKENTIGIISDVEINGYRFSATQPEDMNEGEVWIEIGISSDTFIDIIHGVTVYCMSTRQCVNGVWVDVTNMVYQNDEWKKLFNDIMLMQNGSVTDEYGSFGNPNRYTYASTAHDRRTFSLGTSAEKCTLSWSHHSGKAGFASSYAYFSTKFVLTDVKQIIVKTGGLALGSSQSYDLIVLNNIGDNASNYCIAAKHLEENTENILDVSTISGSYYIGIQVYCRTYDSTALEVEEWRLVK